MRARAGLGAPTLRSIARAAGVEVSVSSGLRPPPALSSHPVWTQLWLPFPQTQAPSSECLALCMLSACSRVPLGASRPHVEHGVCLSLPVSHAQAPCP